MPSPIVFWIDRKRVEVAEAVHCQRKYDVQDFARESTCWRMCIPDSAHVASCQAELLLCGVELWGTKAISRKFNDIRVNMLTKSLVSPLGKLGR